MKKLSLTILIAVSSLMLTAWAYASSEHNSHSTMDHNTMDHSAHQGHAMESNGSMAAGHGGDGTGMKIHTASLDGYTLEYKLIDMKAKMKEMKNMPEMKDTHHLMVYVKDAAGTAVTSAKVGYFISDQKSGAVQKKMAMAMSKGFGADVTLEPGGHYTIKTKVMAGGKKMIDEFHYMGGGH